MKLWGGDKDVEYSVYAVRKLGQSNDNYPNWERKHRSDNYRKALARAKILHRSDNYARVEVKKTVCDARNICTVTEGYKVFNKSSRQLYERRVLYVALCFGVALMVGLFFV